MKTNLSMWAQSRSEARDKYAQLHHSPRPKGHRAREFACLSIALSVVCGAVQFSRVHEGFSVANDRNAVGCVSEEFDVIRLVLRSEKSSSREVCGSALQACDDVKLLAKPHEVLPASAKATSDSSWAISPSNPPFYAMEGSHLVQRHWPLAASRLFDFTVFPNCLDVDDLKDISGLGLASASKIFFHRTANGDFESLQSMQTVRGIGPAKLQHLRRGLGERTNFQACVFSR